MECGPTRRHDARPLTPATGANNDGSRVLHDVPAAGLFAALDGHAGVGGPCADGRFEMPVDSVREVDLDGVVRGQER